MKTLKEKQRQDEMEFIKYILAGKGYTKEYYILMLKERLKRLKHET